MAVKMNLRIITKNRAADPGIRFLTKSISKPNGRATAMPTARELKNSHRSTFIRTLFESTEIGFLRGALSLFLSFIESSSE